MIPELEKNDAIQLFAEITHVLGAKEEDAPTREFILGACFMGHQFLKSSPAFITNSEILDAIAWCVIESKKFDKR